MEVYFDNSATTRPYDEVIDEMARAMRLEMRYGLMKGVPVGT